MSATKKIFALVESAYKQGQLVSRFEAKDPAFSELVGYFPNRILHFRYTLNNGRLHGVGQRWFENGRLEQEDPFHKSILHGRQRLWFRNGRLRAELNYTNNHLDGLRREWYASGQASLECTYEMNRLEGLLTEWHENGQIRERVPYWQGQRHGILKACSKKGKSLPKEIYVRGLRYTGTLRRLVNSSRVTPEILRKIGSTAVRRFLLEEIGYARLLQNSPAHVLDKDGEYELFKINWHQDEEPLHLVKVRCPSTGTFYTLRVSPQVRSVREAIAWTFSLEAAQYVPEEES